MWKVNVGAVCTREVVVAAATEPLLGVASLMRQHHVGTVVLVAGRGGKNHPTGIISDRDLVVEGIARAPDRIADLTAGDLITRELVTVQEDDTIDHALEVMRSHGVRRLPVVDAAGALIGILATDDLIDLFAGRLAAVAAVTAKAQRVERETRP